MPLSIDGIVFSLLAADPSTPVEGECWYNTTAKQFKLYTGTEVQAIKGFPFTVRTVDASNPSADYATIQAAIDAASSGDVILVGPGTYNEQVTLKNGVRVIGHGTYDANVTARTSISATIAATGAVVTGPATGVSFIENCYITASHTTNKNVRLMSSSGGAIFAHNCTLSGTSSSGVSGSLYGAYASGSGVIQLYECYVYLYNDSSNSVDCVGVEVADGSVSLDACFTSTGGTFIVYDVRTNNAAAMLYIYGATRIDGMLNKVSATSINVYGDNYIGSTNGIADDASETIFNHYVYGALLTNGKNDAYKLALRANSADVTTGLANGNIWYNSTDKVIRFRLNGITKKIGEWPFGKVITVDPTDPTADYTTLPSAVSAASSGDIIILSPDTYTLVSRLYIPTGITIVGGAGVCGRLTTISLTAGNGGPTSVLYCNNGGVSFIGLTVSYNYNGSTANIEAMSVEGGSLSANNCRFTVNASSATGGTAIGLHLNGGGATLDDCECNVTDAVTLSSRSGCRIDTAETLSAQRTSFVSVTDGLRIEHASATATLVDCSVPQTLRVTSAANVYLDGGTRVGTIVDTGSVVQMRGTPLSTYQEKTSPVSADRMILTDSASSYKYKSVQMGNLVAHKVRETGGPTDLTLGAITDGQYLKRNGSTVVGSTPAGGGDVVGPSSATANAVVRYDGTTGKLIKDSSATLDDDGAISVVGLINSDFTRLSGDLTPTQITSNQNDYSPTGLADNTILRLSTDASRTVTGLTGGADGRVIIIINVGTNALVLANESGSSTAANRFTLGGADITLRAGGSLALWYDSTDSRWRLFDNNKSALPDLQSFSSSGTWTKPLNATRVRAICAGGGGGGGSGGRGNTNDSGGGGGGGGALDILEFDASSLGATETVTVATAVNGGAAQTVNGAGNAGTAGGSTSFGSWMTAVGGGAGGGGATASGTAGSATFGCFVNGAGGGAGDDTGAGAAGTRSRAGGGGGGGGGVNGGASITNGGAGGAGGPLAGANTATGGGGTAGTGSGTSGGNGTSGSGVGTGGAGGGGGAGNLAGNGGTGGNGGTPSGGGGGGGATSTGTQSGAGGQGAAGYCWVISW